MRLAGISIGAGLRALADGNMRVSILGLDRTDGIARTMQVFKGNALEMERLKAHQVEAEKRAAEETTHHATAVAAASEQASANVQTVASAAEEQCRGGLSADGRVLFLAAGFASCPSARRAQEVLARQPLLPQMTVVPERHWANGIGADETRRAGSYGNNGDAEALNAEKRVLLADDHRLFCEAVKLMLERADGFRVECAFTIDEAVAKAGQDESFDLVLVDLRMPDVEGLDGLRRILDAGVSCPVALISGHVDRHTAEQAFELGAAGVVPKTSSARALQHAIGIMIEGERYIPAPLFSDLPAADGRRADSGPQLETAVPLTPRETDVLGLLVEGMSNKEIGKRLGIGPMTVAQHLTGIFRKLGVTSRTQAIRAALQRRDPAPRT